MSESFTVAQKSIQDLVTRLNLPVTLDFPITHVLRVRLNSPRTLNTIPASDHIKYDELWTHFETEPSLRVAIITGTGRVFCAGADLKGWKDTVQQERQQGHLKNQDGGYDPTKSASLDIVHYNGFLALSDRSNKKPIIAALNGSAYGGGTEALLNCDLVVAVANATIALPEPRRSVAALAGALPRLGRLLPLQRSMELALIAEPISAVQAQSWGIVNRVEPTNEDVQARAIDLARKILLSAPEALKVTLTGVRRGYEDTFESLKDATKSVVYSQDTTDMNGSENIQEGLEAFGEKREPRWKL